MARIFGVKDLAARWSMHPKSVSRIIARGDLKRGAKVAGMWRFTRSSIEEYELDRWGEIQDERP